MKLESTYQINEGLENAYPEFAFSRNSYPSLDIHIDVVKGCDMKSVVDIGMQSKLMWNIGAMLDTPGGYENDPRGHAWRERRSWKLADDGAS